MIKIAVLGYGTIGSGVVEVLETNREHITQTAGQEIEVKYVLDLRDFPGDPIQEKIVHDYEIIKNDPEIQIVVEAMGGVEPAYTFVKGALLEGKHVATSNKALVAKHGAELLEIAKEREINFLFECRWWNPDHPSVSNFTDSRYRRRNYRNPEWNHELYAYQNEYRGFRLQ